MRNLFLLAFAAAAVPEPLWAAEPSAADRAALMALAERMDRKSSASFSRFVKQEPDGLAHLHGQERHDEIATPIRALPAVAAVAVFGCRQIGITYVR